MRAYKEPKALYRVQVCPSCDGEQEPNPLAWVTGLKLRCKVCGRITNLSKTILRREED